MPGEIRPHMWCVTCSRLTNSREGKLIKANDNNGQQVDQGNLMEEEEYGVVNRTHLKWTLPVQRPDGRALRESGDDWELCVTDLEHVLWWSLHHPLDGGLLHPCRHPLQRHLRQVYEHLRLCVVPKYDIVQVRSPYFQLINFVNSCCREIKWSDYIIILNFLL